MRSLLPQAGALWHHATGIVLMAVGAPSVLGLVVYMNELALAPPPRDVAEGVAIEIEAPKPKPKPKLAKPPPPPKPKTNVPPPPSLAALTSGLGGMSIEIPGVDFESLGGADAEMLGAAGEVVHTSDTVDEPPVATQTVPPEYPRKLRDRGISGYVIVSILVNDSGAVERTKVLEAKPPGAFDDAAIDAVTSWRFRPATYQQSPVKAWVRQKIRFDLS